MSSFNQNFPTDLETTPKQKSVASGSAKRKLETDRLSQSSSPQVVPSKKAMQPEFPLPLSTPQKSRVVGSPLSSPSPSSTRRKASYGEIKDNLVRFNTQLQTSCKAALYDLSRGDTKSVGCTLQGILGQSKSFVDSTLHLLNREDQYCRATVQQNNTLNSFNQQFKQENIELKSKLKQLSELESAMFNDGFEVELQTDKGDSEQEKGEKNKETEEQKVEKESKETKEEFAGN